MTLTEWGQDQVQKGKATQGAAARHKRTFRQTEGTDPDRCLYEAHEVLPDGRLAITFRPPSKRIIIDPSELSPDSMTVETVTGE
jgi:hypothetical protein